MDVITLLIVLLALILSLFALVMVFLRSGKVGPQGSSGNTGAVGPTGQSIGNTGYQGQMGQTGGPGPTGQTGIQGYQGPPAQSSGTTKQGSKGPTGQQGITGYQGQVGQTGVGSFNIVYLSASNTITLGNNVGDFQSKYYFIYPSGSSNTINLVYNAAVLSNLTPGSVFMIYNADSSNTITMKNSSANTQYINKLTGSGAIQPMNSQIGPGDYLEYQYLGDLNTVGSVRSYSFLILEPRLYWKNGNQGITSNDFNP